ncbi:ABC-type transporter Mla subunit MlaD [Xanthomonas campestris]|nr:ABC-type transporter Mla subunit MlaD [Xanthomonas sp. 3075]
MADADAALHASRQSLQEAIDVMATFIAAQQQREHGLEDLVRQQLQLLQSAVSHTDQRINRVLENALPRLTQLSHQALEQTLEPAATRFNKQMADAGQTLQQASQRYAQAQRSLETAAQRRIWIGFSAMVVGAIMAAGGASYAVMAAKPILAEAAQRRAEIAYLDRVIRADLVPCGKDRLCAEVEKKGPRYGERGQYRVIVLRNSTSQ